MTASAELVGLLYSAIFGRDPDPVGLGSWSKLIDDGLPARDLVGMLLDTDEARVRASSRGWFRQVDHAGTSHPMVFRSSEEQLLGLRDAERSVHSQNGEDGIIEMLARRTGCPMTMIEIGAAKGADR